MDKTKVKKVLAPIFYVVGGLGVIPLCLLIIFGMLFGAPDPDAGGQITLSLPQILYDHLLLVLAVGIISFFLFGQATMWLNEKKPED